MSPPQLITTTTTHPSTGTLVLPRKAMHNP